MAKSDKANAKDSAVVEAAPPLVEEAAPESLKARLSKLKKSKCCSCCTNIVFLVLGIFTILTAIAVIITTVVTIATTGIYSAESNGRFTALILLIVTALITVGSVIYAIVGVYKQQTRPLHAVAIVLGVLALLQAIIAGVAVNVTPSEQAYISKSLAESFRLSRENNPETTKLWAVTEYQLSCCGLYGPEDYRGNLPAYFPPDVPISCCREYNPDQSSYAQEREREICKAKKHYHSTGCRNLVVEVFMSYATILMSNTVGLIFWECILALGASCRSRNSVNKNKLPQ